MQKSSSNIAVALPIEHRERDTFRRTFTFSQDGVALNVSAWVFRFAVRVPGGQQSVEKTDGEGLSRPSASEVKVDEFTLELTPGNYVWELEADLPGGEHRTFFSAPFVIVANQTAP